MTGSSLRLLNAGERGIVTGVKSTDDRIALQLKSMDITVGTRITLEQRFPRFIVQAGTSRMALSEKMIGSIYVRVL